MLVRVSLVFKLAMFCQFCIVDALIMKLIELQCFYVLFACGTCYTLHSTEAATDVLYRVVLSLS